MISTDLGISILNDDLSGSIRSFLISILSLGLVLVVSMMSDLKSVQMNPSPFQVGLVTNALVERLADPPNEVEEHREGRVPTIEVLLDLVQAVSDRPLESKVCTGRGRHGTHWGSVADACKLLE